MFKTKRIDDFYEALFSTDMYDYGTATENAKTDDLADYKDDFEGWLNHLVDVYANEFPEELHFEPIDKEALLADIVEDEEFRTEMKEEFDYLIEEAENAA